MFSHCPLGLVRIVTNIFYRDKEGSICMNHDWRRWAGLKHRKPQTVRAINNRKRTRGRELTSPETSSYNATAKSLLDFSRVARSYCWPRSLVSSLHPHFLVSCSVSFVRFREKSKRCSSSVKFNRVASKRVRVSQVQRRIGTLTSTCA